MHKKFSVITIIVLALSFTLWFAAQYRVAQSPSLSSSLEYVNNQYGFQFSLPQDWKDYVTVRSTWRGDALDVQGQNVPREHGPLILIRNLKWTAQKPYQDIPIMVFTLAQWESLQRDEFHIGAAPIEPSELGRNAQSVFALPARYNFAFPLGYEEVQQILDSHPLQAL